MPTFWTSGVAFVPKWYGPGKLRHVNTGIAHVNIGIPEVEWSDHQGFRSDGRIIFRGAEQSDNTFWVSIPAPMNMDNYYANAAVPEQRVRSSGSVFDRHNDYWSDDCTSYIHYYRGI
jgi:hypothetical protein